MIEQFLLVYPNGSAYTVQGRNDALADARRLGLAHVGLIDPNTGDVQKIPVEALPLTPYRVAVEAFLESGEQCDVAGIGKELRWLPDDVSRGDARRIRNVVSKLMETFGWALPKE